tara:strand:- start:213 stop:377 length:165 start_codon:yes stop_codon:yes gene_type:complete
VASGLVWAVMQQHFARQMGAIAVYECWIFCNEILTNNWLICVINSDFAMDVNHL